MLIVGNFSFEVACQASHNSFPCPCSELSNQLSANDSQQSFLPLKQLQSGKRQVTQEEKQTNKFGAFNFCQLLAILSRLRCFINSD